MATCHFNVPHCDHEQLQQPIFYAMDADDGQDEEDNFFPTLDQPPAIQRRPTMVPLPDMFASDAYRMSASRPRSSVC